MEEENKTTRSGTKKTIVLLIIICITLAVALAASILYILRERNRSIAAISRLQDNYTALEEETIPIEVFKQHSNQYSVGIPFLQSFFQDTIVYKNDTGVAYAPIDHSLPKNNYNFEKLTYQNKRAKYQDINGITALTGIDVSKYQGEIDWKKVKNDGISYAFIRAGVRGYSTGDIVADEKFIQNMKEASESGIDLGVYFYSQAVSVLEAEEEAQFVLNAIKEYPVSYPVVFDMEDIGKKEARTANLTQKEITDITIAFCKKIKAAGYTPMIYGNVQWMIENLELGRLTEYDKWFAQYFNKPFFPYEFQMWQYTCTGKVNGIKGNVDINLCFKNYEKKTNQTEHK